MENLNNSKNLHIITCSWLTTDNYQYIVIIIIRKSQNNVSSVLNTCGCVWRVQILNVTVITCIERDNQFILFIFSQEVKKPQMLHRNQIWMIQMHLKPLLHSLQKQVLQMQKRVQLPQMQIAVRPPQV